MGPLAGNVPGTEERARQTYPEVKQTRVRRASMQDNLKLKVRAIVDIILRYCIYTSGWGFP